VEQFNNGQYNDDKGFAVLAAERQVVAGLNYHVKVEVKRDDKCQVSRCSRPLRLAHKIMTVRALQLHYGQHCL